MLSLRKTPNSWVLAFSSTAMATALVFVSRRGEAEPAKDAPTGESSGLFLGARVGFAWPAGNIRQGNAIADTYRTSLPLGAEAGYHVGARVVLAGYFEYAFLSVEPSLCPKIDCSGHDLRLGVLGAYRFDRGSRHPDAAAAASRWVPWIGLGLGYEATRVSLSLGDQRAGETDHGFLADPEVGIDYMLGGPIGIGALVALPIGVYASASIDNPIASETYAVAKPALHYWLTAAVRVVYAK